MLFVLTGQAAGRAWSGLGARWLEGAGWVLSLQVVSLLSQVHDKLEGARESIDRRVTGPDKQITRCERSQRHEENLGS